MGQPKIINLPIEDVFGIVEDFVETKGASTTDQNRPIRLYAKFGSVISRWCKANFSLQKKTDNETTISLEVSYNSYNVSFAIAGVFFLAVVFWIFGAALNSGSVFAGSSWIFLLIMLLLFVAIVAAGFRGRYDIEDEFWDYLAFRTHGKVSNENQALEHYDSALSQNDPAIHLERAKESLIAGRISEQEYLKIRRHAEVDMRDETGEKQR